MVWHKLVFSGGGGGKVKSENRKRRGRAAEKEQKRKKRIYLSCITHHRRALPSHIFLFKA